MHFIDRISRMKLVSKPLGIVAISTFILAACTGPDGQPRENTTGGAAIGAVVGAVGGLILGGKPKDVLIGTAVGAGIGGIIGDQLDKQEEALRNSLGNSGAVITNTGSELIVTLPEAITFETDSTFVRPSLQNSLRRLALNLQDYPDSTVDVIGHTDNVGASSYNQQLSANRAQSVSSILIGNGVASSRIRAYGRGETEPVASNGSSTGRAQNRRVEIVIRPTG
jgi:outer membrane protein OmpA-like peptidoglycan-associated protein